MLKNNPSEDTTKPSMTVKELNQRAVQIIRENLAVINFILEMNWSEIELVQLINWDYRLWVTKINPKD